MPQPAHLRFNSGLTQVMTRYCGGLRSWSFCRRLRRCDWAKVRREPVVMTSLYSLLRLVTLLAVLSLTAVAISVLLVTLVHA